MKLHRNTNPREFNVGCQGLSILYVFLEVRACIKKNQNNKKKLRSEKCEQKNDGIFITPTR